MSFDAKESTIRSLFSNSLYRIPRNQRQYVWDKDNWNDLLSDILFSKKNAVGHFLGSIVLKEEKETQGLPTFTIIDGQQRIMTLTILMTVILYCFKELGMEDDYNGSEKYLIVTDNKNKKHNVFESEYHTYLSEIIEELSGLEFKTKNSLSSFLNINLINPKKDKRIVDCFYYFYNTIKSENIDMQNLVLLRDALINVTYVKIVATTEEDSYTIFEILNARGQSLADHELIKNYIMRYIYPKEDRDEVKIRWENMESDLGKGLAPYIKHYTIHKFPINEINKADPYKNIKKNVPLDQVNIFFNDLMLKSKYYSKLYNPMLFDSDGNVVCSKIEFDTFKFFKANRQEQFRPVLISLMHQKELEHITKSEYENAINFIRKFFICYTLIGKEKSNTLTDLIAKYAYNLENKFSNKMLSEFISKLTERIPNEGWFINNFQSLGWSNHSKFFSDEKEKTKAKLALELYEQYLSNRQDNLDFTIEHILPDSEGENNAKIGNLLPLEEELNEKCGDKKLNEKMIFYKKSNFITVKKFIERYENHETDYNVDKRLNYMAKEFYNHIIN